MRIQPDTDIDTEPQQKDQKSQ